MRDEPQFPFPGAASFAMVKSRNTRPESAALAGRWQYSPMRFSMRAMSRLRRDRVPLRPFARPSDRARSCSRSSVISCGPMRRKQRHHRALTPPPVTMTPVTLSSDCPPRLHLDGGACWPPAG
jgi:hypothetical protein